LPETKLPIHRNQHFLDDTENLLERKAPELIFNKLAMKRVME